MMVLIPMIALRLVALFCCRDIFRAKGWDNGLFSSWTIYVLFIPIIAVILALLSTKNQITYTVQDEEVDL